MQSFDPSYGYTLASLLEVSAPEGTEDFCHFWQSCYQNIQSILPLPSIQHTGRQVGAFELFDLQYQSSEGITIKGWLLLPSEQSVKRVMIVGHGYGGCVEPNGNIPLLDCAYIYLCYRGISLSSIDGVPEDPMYHVLFNIHDKDKYILRGCIEDTWMAVRAAKVLFPSLEDHIGFMGISFSGGIGALAIPWEKAIKMAHLQVPTFGHQPLRFELPTLGSARAVQQFYKQHPGIMQTLDYYDAAVAAEYINIPVHIAAALADPVVAPPGQFAIYNQLNCKKELFVLEKGHAEYPNQAMEQAELLEALSEFFSDL